MRSLEPRRDVNRVEGLRLPVRLVLQLDYHFAPRLAAIKRQQLSRGHLVVSDRCGDEVAEVSWIVVGVDTKLTACGHDIVDELHRGWDPRAERGRFDSRSWSGRRLGRQRN